MLWTGTPCVAHLAMASLGITNKRVHQTPQMSSCTSSSSSSVISYLKAKQCTRMNYHAGVLYVSLAIEGVVAPAFWGQCHLPCPNTFSGNATCNFTPTALCTACTVLIGDSLSVAIVWSDSL